MWRGQDIEFVKTVWAVEMGKLTRKEIKRGVDALIMRDWPPTLPEFVKLCKTQDGPSAPDMLALPEPQNPNNAANAAKLTAAVADVLQPRENHRAWIHRVIDREKANDPILPAISVIFAKQALAVYQ